MLKTPDQQPPDDSGDERPIGDLVHQLVEDGKAYAKAELNVAKMIAAAKANALKLPGLLFGLAFLVAIAAVNGLAVGVALALAGLIGPLAGGIATFLLFAAIVAALGWLGARKLRSDL